MTPKYGLREVFGMTEEKVLTAAEQIQQAEEVARGYFKQGLNCSECVLASFLEVHGSELPHEVMTLCTGFGGGMGHTQNNCGAVAGAVMALSTVVGRTDPLAKETMEERVAELQQGVYPKVGALVQDMEALQGTLICRELCEPHGGFDSKERKKNCMKLIGACAALAMKHALMAEGKLTEEAAE